MFQFVNTTVTLSWGDWRRMFAYVGIMLEAATILDASLIPAMFIALLAGLLSFLSPCVLPIVPPYLAFMGGVSVGDMEEGRAARRRVLLAASFFVLGLSTVFILLGFAFSSMGRAGICVWMDTMSGSNLRDHPWSCSIRRGCRAWDHVAGILRPRAWHSVLDGCCLLPTPERYNELDEAPSDPDRAHIRSAALDCWPDDADRPVYGFQLVVTGKIPCFGGLGLTA